MFTSPNWPLTYNTNERCEWIVVLPDCTKKVEITFQLLSIAGRLPECDKDQVYVREGLGEEGQLHGPYCHLKEPKPITVESHVANVTLIAGPSHGSSRIGILVTYRAVD